jgi:hypothetical protein
MHIFVDEAGTFIPPPSIGQSSFSLVLALVVPTAVHTTLCYEFLRIRDSWPNNAIEVKGSSLNEAQCAEVADLLASQDALIEMQIIDMGQHDSACIQDLRERQALGVTANLTPQHNPALVRQMEEIARVFREMSNQLFVQAFLMLRLIIEAPNIAELYYVQRSPKELGNFTWVIDRKDGDLTVMERAWSTVILPLGEYESTKNPGSRLEGADYSYFAKYEVRESDPAWARKAAWMQEQYRLDDSEGKVHAIDWKKLVTEDRTFEDSKASLGLQLADICAASIRRGLNGNLQQGGWEPYGALLIRKQSSVPFCLIGGSTGERSTTLQGSALKVWRTLSDRSKSMIL